MKDDQPILIPSPQSKFEFWNTKNDLLEYFFFKLEFTPCKDFQPLRADIFPSIFYYHFLVVKNKFSIEFQNSILHLLSFQLLIFHCNCWGSVPNTLSIRKFIYCSVFFILEVCFPAVQRVSKWNIFTFFSEQSWRHFEYH